MFTLNFNITSFKQAFHTFHLIKYFCLFFFLISSLSSFPQIINLKNYTTKDGLPSNQVYQVVQDSKGYMWFATDYGVSRFDGYKFTNFDSKDGLPDNTVFEIYEDYKGRIWFISSSAKLSYYYNDSIYKYWNNNIFISTIKDIPNITNKSFYVDKQDNVYIGIYMQGNYIISKEGKISRKYPRPPDYRNYILVGSDENSAYIDYNRETYNSKSKTGLVILKEKNYFKSGFPGELISGKLLALLGSKKEIFFSNYCSLNVIYDSLHYVQYRFDKDKIISLNFDKENILWVGTYSGGVLGYKNGDITAKPAFHILDGNAVSNITCDKEGGYWVSTLYNGVYYFPSIKFRTLTTADGLSDNSLNFLTSDGKIVYGSLLSSKYINIISGNEIKKIQPLNISNEEISSLFYDKIKKTLWIAARQSICSYKDGKLNLYGTYCNVSDSSIHHFMNYLNYEIIKDRSGNIWAGSIMGIIKISNNKVYHYDTSKAFFLRTYSLQEDNDNCLWLGSNNGLFKFANGKYIYYGEKNPLFKNRITSIKKCSINNSIWIATKGAGILIMKGDSLKQLLNKDGLLSNHIKHLFIDGNIIWASSNNGINKITISKGNRLSYKIEGFTQDDGLCSNEINCALAADSMVYVATTSGLCVFNSKEIETNKIPPPVYITNLKIMNKDTSVQNNIILPYNQNLIEISFVGLSYRTAGNIIYKYRLSGINDQWTFTKNTLVSYPFLPDGEYKFEVYAMNKDGVYSIAPATITFIINPPFWKTWWFIGVCILLFAGMVRVFIYFRIKAVKKRNALRLKLNKYMQQALSQQMNPHFIFNSLNSIQYYILQNDRLASNKYLSKFASLMRIILDNSQHQLIPLKDELNALNLYIELEAMRFKEKFQFSITVDEKLDTSINKIPPLLIQPYVENAIWHGLMHKEDNGILEVGLRLKDNVIICTITDNGIGREKAAEIKNKKIQTYKSRGTKITGDRLNLINTLNNMKMQINYFDLKDNSGNALGTKVEITIPLIH